ncbi:ROK family transcriptional regulator [Nesterenkonia xinjiangensis]|uniref:Putative NBD/HSP70 family sugar kinase n=1 Tax=Nesterenkonia xinjiangensis TaxID=225327 RepID=A0A7Z0K9D0_9MICC|nr:ROK family transcriptional regulator [Nesterenkonia xinjiangensis]NYJ78619.1 putative NBD/HSP70 family sugar kinase [Nesterenkonia xinjiangensis]
MRSNAPTTVTTSRALVLDLIRTRSPISRVEIAAASGLTQATITQVVRDLMAEGLVTEAGRGRSVGGKPRVLLDIIPESCFAVGLHLNPEETVCVAVDLSGTVVGRLRHGDFGGETTCEGVVQLLAERVAELLAHLGIDRQKVLGLGVVAPGPLDVDAGTLLGPSALPDFVGHPLRDGLLAATGLPVLVDNDATAAAMAEYWSGALVGSRAHCTVFMGAGIGAGIVLDGMIYRGASSITGEFGALPLLGAEQDIPAGSLTPTLEDLAAPHGVVRRMQSLDAAGQDAGEPAGTQDSGGGPPTRAEMREFTRIAFAAGRGDARAHEVVQGSAERLAHGVLMLTNVLDLDSISLAGPGFARAGGLYVAAVRRVVQEAFFGRSRHDVDVRLATHVSNAAAAGGAALVLQQQLAPRALGLAPVMARP